MKCRTSEPPLASCDYSSVAQKALNQQGLQPPLALTNLVIRGSANNEVRITRRSEIPSSKKACDTSAIKKLEYRARLLSQRETLQYWLKELDEGREPKVWLPSGSDVMPKERIDDVVYISLLDYEAAHKKALEKSHDLSIAKFTQSVKEAIAGWQQREMNWLVVPMTFKPVTKDVTRKWDCSDPKSDDRWIPGQEGQAFRAEKVYEEISIPVSRDEKLPGLDFKIKWNLWTCDREEINRTLAEVEKWLEGNQGKPLDIIGELQDIGVAPDNPRRKFGKQARKTLLEAGATVSRLCRRYSQLPAAKTLPENHLALNSLPLGGDGRGGEEYPKENAVFATFTLPGSTPEAIRAMAANSGWFTNSLMQEIRDWKNSHIKGIERNGKEVVNLTKITLVHNTKFSCSKGYSLNGKQINMVGVDECMTVRRLVPNTPKSDRPDIYYFYVWELQNRGALHLHICLAALPIDVPIEYLEKLAAKLKDKFYSLLMRMLSTETVKRYGKQPMKLPGIDMFARNPARVKRGEPTTWRFHKDKWQWDIQRVEKSVGAYVSKYASKEAVAANKKAVESSFCPSRWWGKSTALMEQIKEKRFSYTIKCPALKTSELMEVVRGELEVSQIVRALGWQFCVTANVANQKRVICEGHTEVYYFDPDQWELFLHKEWKEEKRLVLEFFAEKQKISNWLAYNNLSYTDIRCEDGVVLRMSDTARITT